MQVWWPTEPAIAVVLAVALSSLSAMGCGDGGRKSPRPTPTRAPTGDAAAAVTARPARDAGARALPHREAAPLWRSAGRLGEAREPRSIVAIALSADGTRLAAAGKAGRIYLWDPARRALLRQLQARGVVLRLVFRAAGRRLLAVLGRRGSSSPPGMRRFVGWVVREWDLATGKIVRERLGAAAIRGVAGGTLGNYLALVGADGRGVAIHRVADGKWVRALPLVGRIAAASVGPKERYLAAVHARGVDIVALDPARARGGPRRIALPGARDVAWHPDGRHLLVAGPTEVAVYDLGAGPTAPKRRRAVVLPRGARRPMIVAGGSQIVLERASGALAVLAWANLAHRHFLRGVRRPAAVAADTRGVIAASDGQPGSGTAMWEVASGRPRPTLGVATPLLSLAANPRRPEIAAGYGDGTIHFWPLSAKKPTAIVRTPAAVTGLAYRPDGAELASAGRDGSVRVWAVPSGRLVRQLRPSTREIRALAYDPAGRRLATGSADREVKIWETAQGALLATLRGHTGPIRSLRFAAGGRRLVSGGADRRARIWDVATARQLGALGNDRLYALAISARGNVLAAVGSSIETRWTPTIHELLLWTLPERRLRRVELPKLPLALALSPGGDRLAADGLRTRVWETKTGAAKQVLPGPLLPRTRTLAFGPAGQRLAAGLSDGKLLVWSLASNRLAYALPAFSVAPGKPARWASALAWSSDGARLAAGGNRGRLVVVDAAAGKVVWRKQVLRGRFAVLRTLAFDARGRELIGASAVGELLRWRAADGALVKRRRFDAGFSAAALAPGGRLFAYDAFSRKARLEPLPPRAGRAPRVLGASVSRFAVSAGGARVVGQLAESHRLRVWDGKSGRRVFDLGADLGMVSDLVLGPRGRVIAVPGPRITLWDLASRRLVRAFARAPTPVVALALVPGGERLFGLDASGRVRVWSMASGRLLGAVPAGARSPVGQLVVTADGRLVTGGADGLRVWRADPSKN